MKPASSPARRSATDSRDHFQHLLHLLDLESRAEAERALERRRRFSGAEAERTGNTLTELILVDEDAGLGGRYLLRFMKARRGPLPWTRLDIGSPVLLSAHGAMNLAGKGVISERRIDSVTVAFASLPDERDDADTWRIDLADDEVAVERQRTALRSSSGARGRLGELRGVLLGDREPRFARLKDERPLNHWLNPAQRRAVDFALSADDLALIHGPPGTGKTTAVVEVIRRAVRRGHKVLACAPSNMAVDNLFERLLAAGEEVVRLGHPARVLPELRSHTLDLLVEEHHDVQLARRLVKEALALFRRANRHTRGKPERGARRRTRDEARTLMADARRLERQAVRNILDTADILCTTTTGLNDDLLGDRQFDLAVVDEACQSTEPGCWIPLLRSEKLVLAGDHCQLPPTIVSTEAAQRGFGISLFERMMALYGDRVSRLLTVQYRMHCNIMEFSSHEFYDAQLEAAESVREHQLCGLPGVERSPLTEVPVEFIDTAGAGYDEEQEPDGESRLNRGEAALVVRKVQMLLEAGVAARDLAVITPYAAQARLLREMVPARAVEIDSVDGFQGREKEAIVISFVRSNDRGEIGFLSDVRRTNVALTRARRKLLVIGDSATLSSDPFYARLLEYFDRAGGYRTVWDELPCE